MSPKSHSPGSLVYDIATARAYSTSGIELRIVAILANTPFGYRNRRLPSSMINAPAPRVPSTSHSYHTSSSGSERAALSHVGSRRSPTLDEATVTRSRARLPLHTRADGTDCRFGLSPSQYSARRNTRPTSTCDQVYPAMIHGTVRNRDRRKTSGVTCGAPTTLFSSSRVPTRPELIETLDTTLPRNSSPLTTVRTPPSEAHPGNPSFTLSTPMASQRRENETTFPHATRWKAHNLCNADARAGRACRAATLDSARNQASPSNGPTFDAREIALYVPERTCSQKNTTPHAHRSRRIAKLIPLLSHAAGLDRAGKPGGGGGGGTTTKIPRVSKITMDLRDYQRQPTGIGWHRMAWLIFFHVSGFVENARWPTCNAREERNQWASAAT